MDERQNADATVGVVPGFRARKLQLADEIQTDRNSQ